jgi:hypothetical protein
MSLLRLLTAGKSLVGLQPPSNRYQMRERYRLPKFGSASNPFAAPAPAAEEETLETSSDAPPKHQRYQMSPAEFVAARLKETKKLPADPTAEARRTSGDLASEGKARTRAGHWTNKLNPLSWFSRRREEPRSAVPRFSKAPMQGELSLDRVKVVRNDLSEADVEIVTAKPAPKPKSESAAPTDEAMELLKT